VFELISDAVSLWDELGELVAEGRSAVVAHVLGHALGTIHRAFRLTDPDRDPRLAWLPRNLPAVMRLHRPGPGMLVDLCPANSETLRILQRDEGFGEQLERLCMRWQPGTLIHGDIRLDNILIGPPGARPDPDHAALWIVDWEMVRFGDPAWDLAGAFQDFLVYWVSSMPLADDLTVEQLAGQARMPLADLRGATRALWSGYRAAAVLDGAEVDDLLMRAVTFAAARLIQSAYELADRADRLPGPSVLLLQISANLLADPERGLVQLFGIPPAWSAP
jgi:Ser/Thr protein kinase RdoA (MazF antagonist)